MNSNAQKISADEVESLATLDNAGFANISASQTLASLPYLPHSAFRNPTAMTHALDALHRQLHSAAPNAYPRHQNTIQSNLASNIANTIIEANLDYGSKLELLASASKHRIFRSEFSLWQLISSPIKLITTISKYPAADNSEAALIFATAKNSLKTSKNKIILG